MLSKRKLKNSVKNLYVTLYVEMTHYWISWSTRTLKRPSKPNIPKVPEPFQAPITSGLLGVLSSLVIQVPQYHPIASAKPHQLILANTQCFPSSKTLSILWICVGCVWVQISSQGITMGEGRRRNYKDFSLENV